MKIKKIALSFCLLASAGLAHATAVVGTLNSTADLDLQGDFSYAVSMNPYAAGTTIGDATFSYGRFGSTAGFSESSTHYIQNWHPNTYGDAALASVMQSIVYSAGTYVPGNQTQVVTFSFANLIVGDTYKVQMLFGEACCDRGFDVFQDGAVIANDVSPYRMNNYVYGSAFVSNEFVASASTVVFGLGGYAVDQDNNPILNATTLEHVASAAVPVAPSTALILAGLGLLGVSRRRRNA